jgi:AAA+ superfamily predicted ATPase
LQTVFLVLLEYYKGILILTSNRSDSLDRAFESRIDIVLNYDGLGPTARRQVWSNFLKKIPSHAIRVDEEDLDVLAAWDVNGRQIKSAVKTGRILAAHRREPLNLGHLELVLNVRKKGSELLSYPV